MIVVERPKRLTEDTFEIVFSRNGARDTFVCRVFLGGNFVE